MTNTRKILWILFTAALALNVLTWLSVRTTQARWINVPPVPSASGASGFAVGDMQFAYRIISIMLQNMGDSGGRTTSLKDYDYEALQGWFFLADQLDPHSGFMPFLASLYFGSVPDPEKLESVIEYLRVIGSRPEGQNWRWLAHAVFLARFHMKDLDKAYELAEELAAIDNENMPVWTRQTPVFVLTARGDKEMAYDLMLEILKSSADNVHPNEVNEMRLFICTRLLDLVQAQKDPLCENLP